jgi:MarR family transcriptional repressor of emrRAB
MKELQTALIDLQCEMVAERTLANPKEISWLQYDILIQLEKHEKILPSNLSLLLGVSRTKLSKALKDLKALGYIQQSPSLSDGRALYTTITSDGETLLATISDRHNLLYQTALNSLTKQEQKDFTHLANKFSNALRTERVTIHE